MDEVNRDDPAPPDPDTFDSVGDYLEALGCKEASDAQYAAEAGTTTSLFRLGALIRRKPPE